MVDAPVALLGIAATVVLLVCSAFFSSSETAIFSLPGEWIDQQDPSTDRSVQVLQELHDDPHRLLVTLLVGNNVVNLAIASITTVLVSGYLPPGPTILLTTLLSAAVILIFGEIVPKAYGLGNARTWSVRVARPLRYVEILLSPLIWAFDGVTRRINAWLSAPNAIERAYTE